MGIRRAGQPGRQLAAAGFHQQPPACRANSTTAIQRSPAASCSSTGCIEDRGRQKRTVDSVARPPSLPGFSFGLSYVSQAVAAAAASRHLCFAQHLAGGKHKRSTMEQQQTLEHRRGDWYSVLDLDLRDHWFTVPLDYGSPGGEKISVFTREVVLAMHPMGGPTPRSPFSKDSARDQLLSKLRELVDLHKDENLSVTLVGHNLGACLATLSAFDIVENGLSKVGNQPEFPVCAVVFGSPQVGDAAFVARLGRLPNLRMLHVRNVIDLIPQYPGGVLGYVSVGEQLVALLHVVAGWKGKDSGNGREGGFELAVKRSGKTWPKHWTSLLDGAPSPTAAAAIDVKEVSLSWMVARPPFLRTTTTRKQISENVLLTTK
ncbi:hypothetical protein Taro_024276 [Colocasia esculenta]|uniref:Phospholipase A1 n=1 Tax=Colocasia esculenta TaxID=4460 RepID=A0A843VH07_COLES|nr:hypothetical protein [Colocasia esculenta]